MTWHQIVLLAILLLALFLFVTERWRYDVVALLALLAATLSGTVPVDNAFSGFGHPAVITVGAVLVVSRALRNSGLVDLIAAALLKIGNHLVLQLGALTGVVALLSAFMNNVGALALLLPAAIRMARNSGQPASLFLMPIAFASLLGGMTTLIGTPPNIIVAAFRAKASGAPFAMFDFSPVGVGVALAGLFFIALIGWRLIPRRQGQPSREELFQIKDYVSEVRVPEDSKLIGKPLGELESIAEADITIVGLVRGESKIAAPSRWRLLEPGDIMVVEGDSESLQALIDTAKLELEGSKEEGVDALRSDEVSITEAIVKPGSPLEGNTAWTLGLRWRYGVNLLGVARHGARIQGRLKNIQFQAGDILLLQGDTESLQQALPALGCLPLAERGLRLGFPRRVFFTLVIFAAALAASALGFVPVQIGFVGAAVAMVIAGILSLRDAYDSIDWPIIVLLGAMIPVGQALETTGTADLIASGILRFAHLTPPAVTLAVVLVGTMFLSDLVNNAAAAVLMSPIAIGIANGMGASADPFLISVAIGASSAFLTPIGHQSNALVMAPGGYKFGDYWPMGLPLEVVILLVSLPLLLWFWPLGI
jgi:di/tricarboxylate transporter